MSGDHTNLIERLKQLRVILKSGDYDGADLMRAWCAMMDAVDALEADSARISTLTAELRAIQTTIRGDQMLAIDHELAAHADRIDELLATKGEGDKP